MSLWAGEDSAARRAIGQPGLAQSKLTGPGLTANSVRLRRRTTTTLYSKLVSQWVCIMAPGEPPEVSPIVTVMVSPSAKTTSSRRTPAALCSVVAKRLCSCIRYAVQRRYWLLPLRNWGQLDHAPVIVRCRLPSEKNHAKAPRVVHAVSPNGVSDLQRLCAACGHGTVWFHAHVAVENWIFRWLGVRPDFAN